MKHIFLLSMLLMAATLGFGQDATTNNNEGGYLISGDTLLFVFDPKQYELTTQEMGGEKKLEKLKMSDVYVSGTFNGWERKDKNYLMRRQENGTYTLAVMTNEARKPRPVTYYFEGKTYYSGNERTSPDEIQFKFVIDGKYWVEPSKQFTNTVNSGEWKGPKNFIIRFKD